MCDIDIDYFNCIDTDTTLTFTPKELIRDIIWDYSNSFIPFTNGQRYYVYQDIAFQLIDFYEKHFPYLNVQIQTVDDSNKNLPSIIITKIKKEDKDIIIQYSNKLITNYINKKFSLFV
jgi:hypothetical protein